MSSRTWAREEEEKLLTLYVTSGLVATFNTEAYGLEGQKQLQSIAKIMGMSVTPCSKKIKNLLNEVWTADFVVSVAAAKVVVTAVHEARLPWHERFVALMNENLVVSDQIVYYTVRFLCDRIEPRIKHIHKGPQIYAKLADVRGLLAETALVESLDPAQTEMPLAEKPEGNDLEAEPVRLVDESDDDFSERHSIWEMQQDSEGAEAA